MEVKEFVSEDEGDYGVYLIDGEVHESNTSKLSYSWGADKNTIRTQYVEPAAREINREWKRRLAAHEKPLTQEEAIATAYSAIKKHKEQYTVFGTEMHQAFQAFDEGRPIILPTPKHQAYFQGFLYFRRQHQPKTIFTERLLVCPHCGITTQIDNFSEVACLNTVIDYKTGRTVGFNTPFQLAINKHVLEHLGYRVDQTWAAHIQDFFGYAIEMCAEWSDVELRLKNADLKRKTLNPKIYVREFSGEKKPAASETLTTEEEQEFALSINAQGLIHHPQAEETLARAVQQEAERVSAKIDFAYLSQEETERLETVAPGFQPARKRGRPRKILVPEEEQLDPKKLTEISCVQNTMENRP